MLTPPALAAAPERPTRRTRSPRLPLLSALAALVLSLGLFAPKVAHAQLDSAFGPTRNMWVDRDFLQSVPTSGSAWQRLADDARGSWGSANISDQDSDHDIFTLAGALYAVRKNDTGMRNKVVAAIEQAMGTENGGRTLALGRNLTGYVLAADIVGYDTPAFRSWLSSVRREQLDGRTLVNTHEERANNWGTHAGAARIAIDIFIADRADLDRATRVFRGFLGDRSAYAGFNFGDGDWIANPSRPVPINPAGARINGINVDGALVDDIRRCGCPVQSPAPKENYQWEAMQGLATQAVLLQAAGVDEVWRWSDSAMLRAVRFLYEQARFPAEGDDTSALFLLDAGLGTGYSVGVRANVGKSIAYTDVTHPSRGGFIPSSSPVPSSAPAPWSSDPMRYVPVEQTRLLDTRSSGRLWAGQTIDVKVAGRAGVPSSNVGAVALNLTATRAFGSGYVTAWANGQLRPPTSSLNVNGPGEIVPNLVIVPVGDGGAISLYTSESMHLIADVSGYFVEDDDARAGRFVPVDPERLFDTRDTKAPSGVVADRTISVPVAGEGGVPSSGADIAVINVAAVGLGEAGYVTVYGHGDGRPGTSSLNFDNSTSGRSVRSNLVFAPIGADGRVDFYVSRPAHVVADVVGYFTDDSASRKTQGMFVATNSVRHVDTRLGRPGGAGRLSSGETEKYRIGGIANVPGGNVMAVMTNLTAARSTTRGYLTMFANGSSRPSTSSVSLDASDPVRSNAAIVELGSGDQVAVYSHQGSDVILDVFGYFLD